MYMNDQRQSVAEDIGPELPDSSGYLELTEAQFDARYLPETNEDGSVYRQREWFIPEDKEAILLAIQEKRCWTMVECDGAWSIEWGNRTVNRLYNIITKKPIEDEAWHVCAFDPDAETSEEDE